MKLMRKQNRQNSLDSKPQCFKSLRWFLVFTLLIPGQHVNHQGDPVWRLWVRRGNRETFTDSVLVFHVIMNQQSRKTKICKQSFVHKRLQVTWKHFQRIVCSVQRESPFSLLSKSFWHNGHPYLSFKQAMLMISLLHIFHKSITTLPISEFRRYGLCRALLVNSVKDQIGDDVDLKREHKTPKG